MRFIRCIALLAVIAGIVPVGARAGVPCVSRVLVLSAFPGEIDGLLHEASITHELEAGGRTFYVGTLKGNDVVLALTGIGLVNAQQTAATAVSTFTCGISSIVFSGVSGGKEYIGDVAVPSRWTLDGQTWHPVDPSLLAIAGSVSPALLEETPLGDIACVGIDPDLVRTFPVERAPSIFVGGDGKSADPFGGRRFPCTPGGGDVFGCEPCRRQSHDPAHVQRFVDGAPAFMDPAFFFDYFSSPPPADTSYDAEDMESAAVAAVASQHGIPFIAIRALSDGRGDPLHLPGFPFQFFVYRQIAAHNAAVVTLAFLGALT